VKGDCGPEYIFASNLRTDKHLKEAREFIQSLLEYMRFNPEKLNRKPFLKKVLWRILHWNLPRVDGRKRGALQRDKDAGQGAHNFLVRLIGHCIFNPH
jgi:hypothetical protein